MAETNLRPLQRLITTHNEAGQAIFSSALPETAPTTEVAPGLNFTLGYSTTSFPASLANDSDITSYGTMLSQPPGLAIPNGTVCRIVEFAPGSESIMHRTVSLDYGIVLEGEIELELDSGEKRKMERGDIAVQRATMHAWRNVGEGWARMCFVLTACEAPVVGGKPLGEEGTGAVEKEAEGPTA
jgi:quercetin dioxygenase-like cupin family protein